MGQTPSGNNLGSQQTPAGPVSPLVTQLTSTSFCFVIQGISLYPCFGPWYVLCPYRLGTPQTTIFILTLGKAVVTILFFFFFFFFFNLDRYRLVPGWAMFINKGEGPVFSFAQMNHCAVPMAFLLLYEMLREFQKHEPQTNHNGHAHHRAGKNNRNSNDACAHRRASQGLLPIQNPDI